MRRITSARPVRVGLRPSRSILSSEPGTIAAATMKKAADEKSPGTSMPGRARLGLASTVNLAGPSGSARETVIPAPALRSIISV
jgi:hypothetical protein